MATPQSLRSAALLLAAAGLLAAPLPAGAEGQSTRLSLRPSLRTAAILDDNPTLDEDGDDAIGFWIRPRVEVGYDAPDVSLGADLSVDLRRYAGYRGELSDELPRLHGFAEVGLAPGLTLRVADAYVPQPVQIGRPSDESANLVQSNRAEATLRYWRTLAGPYDLEVGVRGTHFLSEDFAELVPAGAGVAVDDDFHADFVEGLGWVELHRSLGERGAVYVRGQGSYREISEESAADHSMLGLVAGVRARLGRSADVDVAVGGAALGFDSLADDAHWVGRGTLRYRLPSGWSLSFGASHLATVDLLGRDALETTGRLGIEKYLSPRTAGSIDFFTTRFDVDGRGAADLFGGLEVRLRHQLSRITQLQLAYRGWHDRGDGVGSEFTQNRLSIEFHLRP
jgi:hypothetical protein